MEKHGGSIFYEPGADGGNVFAFRVPLNGAIDGKDKILIADDETDIALILKLQLEDAGYRTVRVKDGVEALEALARESSNCCSLI